MKYVAKHKAAATLTARNECAAEHTAAATSLQDCIAASKNHGTPARMGAQTHLAGRWWGGTTPHS